MIHDLPSSLFDCTISLANIVRHGIYITSSLLQSLLNNCSIFQHRWLPLSVVASTQLHRRWHLHRWPRLLHDIIDRDFYDTSSAANSMINHLHNTNSGSMINHLKNLVNATFTQQYWLWIIRNIIRLHNSLGSYMTPSNVGYEVYL